jgi:hypothetical protein
MRTSLIVAVAALSGIMGGYLLGIAMAERVPLGTEASVEWHWKRVNDYNAFMRDPKNLSSSHIPGLNALTPPYDVDPSLLALENSGEIYHVDLVLPNVPSTSNTNQFWMGFCGDRDKTILHATGNSQYADFRPSGDQPLHLKIWFKKSAVADIQKLIVELESLASDQRVEDL